MQKTFLVLHKISQPHLELLFFPNVALIAASITAIRCFVYSEMANCSQIAREAARYFFTEPSETVAMIFPPHRHFPASGILLYFEPHRGHRNPCFEKAFKFPIMSLMKWVVSTRSARSSSSTARIFRARTSSASSLSTIE